MNTEKGAYYSGTSNIVLPVPNKTMFPAAFQSKSRLCYYASLFNSLEVNSSFYKIPLGRTVEKWAADVPDNFRFTFKLWQGITHNKGLIFNPDDVNRFTQVIANAGNKAGCLLVQFPASITSAYCNQFERLLISLRDNDPELIWKIAIEFRSNTWYRDDIYRLLDSYQMGFVLHDMPASLAPMINTAADFIYLRFHGPEKGYRGSYADDFLYEYAGYIEEWRNEGKIVYAY
ncbi:MAG: hypothetical protein JWO98_5490, partial [Frankiales bacterium]|nr:hypothetical protein [Frankiales bacterium]